MNKSIAFFPTNCPLSGLYIAPKDMHPGRIIQHIRWAMRKYNYMNGFTPWEGKADQGIHWIKLTHEDSYDILWVTDGLGGKWKIYIVPVD